MLDNYTIEQLQDEIDRRATATKLTGVIRFQFAGLEKADRWKEIATGELLLSGDSTFDVSEPYFDGTTIVYPYEYTAVGASKSDVARFCVRTMGKVLTDSGNQRLHPNGLSIGVSDASEVPGRRLRMRRDT